VIPVVTMSPSRGAMNGSLVCGAKKRNVRSGGNARRDGSRDEPVARQRGFPMETGKERSAARQRSASMVTEGSVHSRRKRSHGWKPRWAGARGDARRDGILGWPVAGRPCMLMETVETNAPPHGNASRRGARLGATHRNKRMQPSGQRVAEWNVHSPPVDPGRYDPNSAATERTGLLFRRWVWFAFKPVPIRSPNGGVSLLDATRCRR
jgi:hypothetical protein